MTGTCRCVSEQCLSLGRQTYKNLAHEAPGATPGDVLVRIKCREHPEFERQGDDLLCHRNVTLLQSLTGDITFTAKLPNNQAVRLQHRSMVKHGEILRFPNLGMPVWQGNGKRGALLVEVAIVFPSRLAVDDDRRSALRETYF